MQTRLFPDDNPVAARQPKTDRLFIKRLLDAAGANQQIKPEEIAPAQAILCRWADLESSGRLATLSETQLQGDFLAEVFGQALGYARAVENAESWHLEQHRVIAGQTPDAVLGEFKTAATSEPLAVIELKGPTVHPDRDRSNGRTAVDQCWDYIVNTPPQCRWGIVSNMVSFRLYERDSTKRKYEHFTLQSLRNVDEFRRFYAVFHRKGLIEKTAGQLPRALDLLRRTDDRQRQVGDELYEAYSNNRTNLIAHLMREGHALDDAIEMAQRLFDRVIFIAFCEDRALLPKRTIETAYKTLPGFSAATNPIWQQFKTLFRFVDTGSEQHHIPPYNGGLFAEHAVDKLELPDKPWTNFFASIGGYDFDAEVNLDVLGHLFERSITELEKLKASGLFGGDVKKAEEYARMPQSAKRKRLGIYYTPPELTSRIVQYTVGELIDQRFAALATEFGIPEAEAKRGAAPDDEAYWRRCLRILRDLKIVDPACGSGAFLFQAYDTLELRYAEVIGHLRKLSAQGADTLDQNIPHWILTDNLYGVDLSPEAVEITQLALWIRSATPGQKLQKLSANIVHGNSLVHDPAVHPAGFDWKDRFAEVFDRDAGGFDCVIGNPPWERIKLQEREFFSLPAPEIATATNAAKRRKLVAKLESDDPALYGRYKQALESADALLTYCRKSKRYPLTGKGDINLYAVFSELAYQLVAPRGRVALLTPSGIASDKTTMDFFAAVAESNRLIRLYDFENRTKKFFPDVDGRFKFCILNYGGADTRCDAAGGADFVFFAHTVEDLEDKKRHVKLSGADIKLLNPNTRTCPIFRTRRDAEITKQIYRRVPVLIDRTRKGPTGNPWGVTFLRIFDQAIDAGHFTTAVELRDRGLRPVDNLWLNGETYLPCYEAKMAQPYDHRAASVRFEDNWARQGQPTSTSLAEHLNPEYLPLPRWWATASAVNASLGERSSPALLAFRKVTSPTNTRTLLANFMPCYGAIDSIQLFIFDAAPMRRRACFLANCNTFALDFVLRQKIGNVNVNYFLVEQLPFFAPDVYEKKCPWDPRKRTLESWISERVLKLSCTAVDMLPLAEACGFTGGSFKKEYGGKLNKWDEAERAQIMAELDAAYFILYGIDRDDAAYILSTFKGIHTGTALFGGASVAGHILDTMDDFTARSAGG